MRKKKEEEEEDDVNRYFLSSPRYVHKYFGKLLGSIILSTCLFWGFVAALANNLLIHHYDKF